MFEVLTAISWMCVLPIWRRRKCFSWPVFRAFVCVDALQWCSFFFFSFIFWGQYGHACWLLCHLFITAWKLWKFFFFLLMQYFFLCLYYIVRCNVVCFLHNSDFIWWQLVWIIVLALFQIVLHFVFYLERVAKLFEEWGKGEMWKKLKDYQDFLSLSLFFFTNLLTFCSYLLLLVLILPCLFA